MPPKRRIIYITNARLPTERAHGLQIVKMCEWFVRSHISVELWIPRRFNPLKEDVFDYYQLVKIFLIKKIFCLDTIPLARLFKKISYWLEGFTFAFFSSRRLSQELTNAIMPIIYTRDLLCIIFLPKRYRIFYEAHNLPTRVGWLFKFLLRRVDGIVTITHGLKNDLINCGYPENKILVAPDAVEISFFSVPFSQSVCRQKFGLPLNQKIVVYTGHFYSWKGVFLMLEAAELVKDVYFLFVGGAWYDIIPFKKAIEKYQLNNVRLVGHQKNSVIPYFLKAADLAILPNSAKERISIKYTSPIKLFEYMAARIPVVAADLPSIREILNEKMTFFFKPDDAVALAEQIRKALNNAILMKKKSELAYETVQNHSWQKRAEKIAHFIFETN